MELKKAEKEQFEAWRGHNAILIRKDGNENYLNKVILEAVTSERKHYGDIDTVVKQCRFDEWELEDGSHWVTLDGNFSGYQRITRRVEFRLSNNKWIQKKSVRLIDESYEVPGQWCKEHRYWYVN